MGFRFSKNITFEFLHGESWDKGEGEDEILGLIIALDAVKEKKKNNRKRIVLT